MELTLEIKLLSHTLPGSGNGIGTEINSDVVFDEFGIPYIPGKRIKGCLRDSACEIVEIAPQNLELETSLVEKIFGKTGGLESPGIIVKNFYLEDYEDNKNWLNYLISKEDSSITVERVKEFFTIKRTATSINKDGVAEEKSLRRFRYLKKGLKFSGEKGLKFSGEIILEDLECLNLLSFACANFRRMGSQRTRGAGEIECSLLNDKKENLIDKYLNELGAQDA